MTPNPCPECERSPKLNRENRYWCSNEHCSFCGNLPLEEWNALPRPSTEPIVSSSVDETPETDARIKTAKSLSVDHYHEFQYVDPETCRRFERHRNALLRFIEESVPHCELCDYSINGATCNCYKSRIPKP
jgi:hypothetical protein